MAIITVAISDLSTWLSNQPENTKDTPYELNITGLTTSNVNKVIRDSLTSNSTKYVDLSSTTIPSGVTNMNNTFNGCTSLVNAPAIPNGVTEMYSTFSNCNSLVTAPVIPSGVTEMYDTFSNCTSLVNAPVIPNGVITLNGPFMNCTSLTVAPKIPSSVTEMPNAFQGCTSLKIVPVIPSGVTEMYATFNGCTSLEKIFTFNVDPSKVASHDYCFTNTPSTLKVYVPTSKLSAWQGITASGWGLSSTSVLKDIATSIKRWVRIA